MGKHTMELIRRAQEAMSDARFGPASIPFRHRALIDQILDRVFEDSEDPSERAYIIELLSLETWTRCYNRVKKTRPGLYNALNIPTLAINRASILEAPESCRNFRTVSQYLEAWRMWYDSIDRAGDFWNIIAERRVRAKDLTKPLAFAGLLIFDIMCMSAAKQLIEPPIKQADQEKEVDIPFAQIADFANAIPFASFRGKHDAVAAFLSKTNAQVLLAQEARHLSTHPHMVKHWHPPFKALDEVTQVVLQRDTFAHAENMSLHVCQKMNEILEEKYEHATDGFKKAWQTTIRRIAAVKCELSAEYGGTTICLASMHCAKDKGTGDLVECLLQCLKNCAGKCQFFVLGLDSNMEASNAEEFQRRLRGCGLDLGAPPDLHQVTVAKQRTMFQTQVLKAGNVDISHKDYVVSWGPGAHRLQRRDTYYMPDLWSAFGVHRETGVRTRLPTYDWPFDHCGVITGFAPVQRRVLNRAWYLWRILPALFAVSLAFMPLGSPVRDHPEAGVSWVGGDVSQKHQGICKADAPCPGSGWIESEGSCYMPTPHMEYEASKLHCRFLGGDLGPILSAAENSFVAERICPEDSACWLGLEREGHDGSLVWSSGLTYQAWDLLEDPEDIIYHHHVVMLQRRPQEIHGCRSDLISGVADFFAYDMTLNCIAVMVSAVVLLAFRPQSASTRLAEKYLVSNFLINAVMAITTMWAHCYSSDMSVVYWLILVHDIFAIIGSAAMNLLLQQVIISRLSFLLKDRQVWLPKMIWRAQFVLLLIMCLLTIIIGANRSSVQSMRSLAFANHAWLVGMHNKKNTPWVVTFHILSIVGFLFFSGFAALAMHRLFLVWRVIHRRKAGLRAATKAALVMFVTVGLSALCAMIWWLLILIPLLASDIDQLDHDHEVHEVDWSLGRALAGIVFCYLRSIFNDASAHVLVWEVRDDTLKDAQDAMTEQAERVAQELVQHDIARAVLQAAPTSPDRIEELAKLEEAVREALRDPAAGADRLTEGFRGLQAEAQRESQRIKQLMKCVRLRYSTMRVRMGFLVNCPSVKLTPPRRQFVAEEILTGTHDETAQKKYLADLIRGAEVVQSTLFEKVNQLVEQFNVARWPSELGVDDKKFTYMIGSSASFSRSTRRSTPVLGEMMMRSDNTGKPTVPGVVMEVGQHNVQMFFSGEMEPMMVPKRELVRCAGAAVFLPGPLKSKQRCEDKIAADYQNTPWPQAASLLDLARCTVVADDPYAAAVVMEALSKVFNVVRVKNRFEDDKPDLETINAERLEAEFALAGLRDAYGGGSGHVDSEVDICASEQKCYRDIMMNVEVESPNGMPIICEIQVCLSSIWLLKKSEQKAYTILRMQSPEELASMHVFSSPVGELLQ